MKRYVLRSKGGYIHLAEDPTEETVFDLPLEEASAYDSVSDALWALQKRSGYIGSPVSPTITMECVETVVHTTARNLV